MYHEHCAGGAVALAVGDGDGDVVGAVLELAEGLGVGDVGPHTGEPVGEGDGDPGTVSIDRLNVMQNCVP